MTAVVHSLGVGSGYPTGTRIGPSCLKLSLLGRSPSSFRLPNRCPRWSPPASQSYISADFSAGNHSGHGIHQFQSMESTRSAGSQTLSTDRLICNEPWGCLYSFTQRVGFAEPGRAKELLALGLVAGALLLPGESWAVDMETMPTDQGLMAWAANEPANALSLPTWIIHIASVAEWVTAMALVWKYGDTPGKAAWKGLTWGMVPLLGGAMCACTWHFFYNAPSLEVLVVLQAFLTVVGNFTLWIAAYRIWKASQKEAPAK